MLAAHEPFPAVVVDRGGTWWTATAAWRCSPRASTRGCSSRRSTCCGCRCTPTAWPRGSATSPQWRAHVLHRLAREARLSGDPALAALHRELSLLPGGAGPPAAGRHRGPAAHPRRRTHELAFLSTVTTFGTAVDVTAAELSLEAFLPADERTAEVVRAAAQTAAVGSSVP